MFPEGMKAGARLPKKKIVSCLEQLLVIHFQDRLAGTRKGHAPQQLGSLKRERVHIFGGGPVHNPFASKGGALGLGLGRSLRERSYVRGNESRNESRYDCPQHELKFCTTGLTCEKCPTHTKPDMEYSPS